MDELLRNLKSTFGYQAFRPLQREIIEATLGGRDVLALLPTGGGKSICFQLPALLGPGLTVVVSPLIALMKDQVDQLQAAGVAATFLNSTLKEKEARSRLAGLHNGEWRLLYAAPERLLLDGWEEKLRQWDVARIAIDEAHCISEWGHDFRPEYRQLARLRATLPDLPVMALTATATERVREDIVQRLKLQEPAVFVASFNRPNLTYRVIPKHQPMKQIVEFVRKRSEESGIVYCASRATAERTAAGLSERGFSARPYHAGLTAAERHDNQESFLCDETRVICATIAFGMGINKPNVRWVVHYDLPKNLESYYQETGRAGRDGLPSECLLLYSAGDVAKQLHFITEMSDSQEQQRARRQLQTMLHYAEQAGCRRADVLKYFGEIFAEGNCGGCDNCLEPRETYDGTVLAQKFLSCVVRIRQASRFSVGMNHIIEVLTGAETEKIRRWNHDQISTYGIGRELNRQQWAGVGRELLRLGMVGVADGPFATLELTETGAEALRTRKPVTLTKQMELPAAKRARRSRRGEIQCDEVLFEHLRGVRKRLADEHHVPAYVVCGDVTLRELARAYPTSVDAMEGISGLGKKKLAEYDELFAREITEYLTTHGRVAFAD